MIIIDVVPNVPPKSNFPDLSTLCAGFPLAFVSPDPLAVFEALRGDRGRLSTPFPLTFSVSFSDLTTTSSAITGLTMDFRRGVFFVEPVADARFDGVVAGVARFFDGREVEDSAEGVVVASSL